MISQLIYSSKKIVITFESKYGHTINYVQLSTISTRSLEDFGTGYLSKGYVLVKIKNDYTCK